MKTEIDGERFYIYIYIEREREREREGEREEIDRYVCVCAHICRYMHLYTPTYLSVEKDLF